MKDKLNLSDAVLLWKFLTLSSLNWKEMQIVWRGSPTDWDQLILESWRMGRKIEKSRDHVTAWKKHQDWANIPLCHGNHPWISSSSMVLYRMPERKAVRDKLIEILACWKIEHVEKKPRVTEVHKITQCCIEFVSLKISEKQESITCHKKEILKQSEQSGLFGVGLR